MALGRFVVTAPVTLTPDAAAAPGTFGSAATITPAVGSEGKFGLWAGVTLQAGMVIFADSAAGFATAAQLLYQAIGAGNLRAYVQGQDDAGHAGLGN